MGKYTRIGNIGELNRLGKVDVKPKIIAKYRHLPYNRIKIQASLDASDNGRCWWIYQFVYNSISYNHK